MFELDLILKLTSVFAFLHQGFSFTAPENMANAVVDVRLIDQQKQNQHLTERIEQISTELSELKEQNLNLLNSVASATTVNIQVNTTSEMNGNIVEQLGTVVEHILKQNSEFTRQIMDSAAKIEQLEQQKSEIEHQLKEQSAATIHLRDTIEELNTRLAKELESYQKVLNSNDEEINGLKTENKNIKIQLLELKQENISLSTSLDEIKKELSGLNDVKSDLEAKHLEELRALQSQCNQIVSRNDELQSNIQATTDDLKKLQLQFSEKLNELERLNADKRNTEERLTKCQEQIIEFEAIKQQHIKLQTDFDQLQSTHKATVENLLTFNEMSSKLDTLTTKNAELEQLNTELTVAVTQAKQEIADLTEKSVNQEAEIGNFKETMQSLSEEMTSKLTTLSAENNNLEKIRAELTAALCDAKSEIEKLTEKLASRDMEIDELKKSQQLISTEMSSKIDALTTETFELKKLNDEIKCAQSEAKKEIANLTESLATRISEINNLEESKQCLMKEHEDLKAINEKNKQVLDELSAEHTNVQVEQKNMQAIIKQFESKERQLLAEIEELQRSSADKSKEIDNLNELLQESDSTIKDLNNVSL